MPQVKRVEAHREFVLDCSYKVKVGEKFIITSLFTCLQDEQLPVAILRESFRMAVAKLQEEMVRLSLRPVGQKEANANDQREQNKFIGVWTIGLMRETSETREAVEQEFNRQVKERDDWFYAITIDGRKFFVAENGEFGYTAMLPEEY